MVSLGLVHPLFWGFLLWLYPRKAVDIQVLVSGWLMLESSITWVHHVFMDYEYGRLVVFSCSLALTAVLEWKGMCH